MRTITNIVKVLLAAAIVIALLAATIGVYSVRHAFPQISGTFRVDGLAGWKYARRINMSMLIFSGSGAA